MIMQIAAGSGSIINPVPPDDKLQSNRLIVRPKFYIAVPEDRSSKLGFRGSISAIPR